jgi:hypothetical protein
MSNGLDWRFEMNKTAKTLSTVGIILLLFTCPIYPGVHVSAAAWEQKTGGSKKPRKRKQERKVSKKPAPHQSDAAQLPRGVWGGDHISLTSMEQGARLEFDCAYGTIKQPISLHKNSFDVGGDYTREYSGPERPGESPLNHPARFIGYVDGKRMELTVTLTDENRTVGPFTLILGQTPRINKCM